METDQDIYQNPQFDNAGTSRPLSRWQAESIKPQDWSPPMTADEEGYGYSFPKIDTLKQHTDLS